MTKPNVADGKLSWEKAGDTTWRALGICDSVPFIAPERVIQEHSTIGSSVPRMRFVQQAARDVTLECKITNWAFVAYCLQSDPAPSSSVRTFVYKAQNVGPLIDIAYDDGVIRYLAEDVGIKRVKLKCEHGQIPTMEVTLSVSKISSVGSDPSGAGTLVAFDTTNELSIANVEIKVGDNALESPRFSFTIEPIGFEHSNVVGAAPGEKLNIGNVKYEMDIEGYYDSTRYDIGSGATWTPEPANTYVATIGSTASTNYFQATLASPMEMSAEFTKTGDHAIKLEKTLRAVTAPTMTCKDAVFTTNRYWTA